MTRLHAAAWTFRRLCGETVELADVVEQRFESYTLRRASAISSPSRALADYIVSLCKVDKGRIEIIPYPIDTERFTPGEKEKRSPVVLFVGRVEKRKGQTF